MNSLFGWKSLSPKVKRRLKSIPRGIVIFPHTTSWDMITLWTYLSSTGLSKDIVHVMVQEPTKRRFYADIIFSGHINPIYVPTTKNKGTIDLVVEKLSTKKKFLLFLSPEGSTSYSQWKSGYFVLSQKLKVPIVIFGFDFVRHEMVTPLLIQPNWNSFLKHSNENNKLKYSEGTIECFDSYNNRTVISCSFENLQETVELRLKEAMGSIKPLFSKETAVSINSKKNSSVVSNDILFLYIIIIGIIGISLFFHPKYTSLGIVCILTIIVLFMTLFN